MTIKPDTPASISAYAMMEQYWLERLQSLREGKESSSARDAAFQCALLAELESIGTCLKLMTAQAVNGKVKEHEAQRAYKVMDLGVRLTAAFIKKYGDKS